MFVKKILYTILTILFLAVIMTGLAFQENFGYAARKSKAYFSKSVKELEIGSAFAFKVAGIKNDGRSVAWSSSDPDIASISKTGKVTAIKRGNVMITAKVVKNGKKLSQGLTILEKTKKQQKAVKDLSAVKNLSKEAKKIEDAGWNDIGFLDWKELDEFCYSLFQKIISLEKENENPVLSPLSAYLALALVADGAKGSTKTQFHKLLGKHMLSTRIHQLTESLSKVSGNTKFSIADSIWIDDLFLPNDSWLSNMVSYYNAEIFQTDLSTDAARLGMNQWVSEKTKKLIPSIFEENLEESVCLVLLNTIYLKAKWENVFEAVLTDQREFTNENGEKKKVDFMNQYRSSCKYFKKQNADGIILPYDDGRLSMIAIRPKGKMTARELAQSLTGQKISGYLKVAKNTYSNLHFPKFNVEYAEKLNDSLIQMGLSDAFSGKKADFTGLAAIKEEGGNLYISEVFQKVKLQVDEDGTEAAAATEISIKYGSAMIEEVKEITFNKPFVYLIIDTKAPFGTQAIPLFMGVVTELGLK